MVHALSTQCSMIELKGPVCSQPRNVLLQFDGLMLPGWNLETEAAILAEVIAAVLVQDNKGLSKFR